LAAALPGWQIPAVPGPPSRRPGPRPRLDPADAGLQACPLGAQVLPGEPDLVPLVRGNRPGHRDDDCAVSARFRAARDCGWPARPAAPQRTGRRGLPERPQVRAYRRSTASSGGTAAAGPAPAATWRGARMHGYRAQEPVTSPPPADGGLQASVRYSEMTTRSAYVSYMLSLSKTRWISERSNPNGTSAGAARPARRPRSRRGPG